MAELVEDYNDWNKRELVDECRERGLETSGNKAQLVARLEEDDTDATQDDDIELESPDGQDADEETLPATPAASETDDPSEGADEPETAGDTFVWSLTVDYPNPYLNDVEWHQENARAAAEYAVRAGHVPTGEATVEHESDVDNGRVTLHYSVPVQP